MKPESRDVESLSDEVVTLCQLFAQVIYRGLKEQEDHTSCLLFDSTEYVAQNGVSLSAPKISQKQSDTCQPDTCGRSMVRSNNTP
jgi:hypothetical protein